MIIELCPETLRPVRTRDMRQLSYNIEMTELTGGTFWKPYTDGQIDGTEPFPVPEDPGEIMKLLMQLHVPMPAIDLYESRIRTLAKALGPVIIRFSGSWATRTYYDFDGHTGGKVPDGFDFVLTAEQWLGALDFAKAVGAEIMVSLANSYGVHENGTGRWLPDQAELLWNFTAEHGMTIGYAEFMNEPNLINGMKLPEGYGAAEYGRDHDLFAAWLRDNHPETALVGPCASDSPRSTMVGGNMLSLLTSAELLEHIKEKPAYFSYHSYAGISERGQFFGNHHPFEKALTEEYLGLTISDLEYAIPQRDDYAPGCDMWVTESADGACGGNTWAPTFAEVFRFLDEAARFDLKARGILFHNTLASSAYGFLDSETHEPRPQYWAALLFNTLCGEVVYDTGVEISEGAHVFAFSRRDGKDGAVYLCINNSASKPLELTVPAGESYILSSDKLRGRNIRLNGTVLEMPDARTMPELKGAPVSSGPLTIAPLTAAFIVV